jgi:hypothetical protein
MITSLRSALLCQRIDQHPDGQIDIIGVRPSSITHGVRPVYDSPWLSLTVDLDGKGSTGFVRLQAPGFDHRLPYSTPAGIFSTGFAMPLILPLYEPGDFVVSVVDGANRTRPLKAKWKIGFTDDVEDRGDHLIPTLLRETNARMDEIIGRLIGPGVVRKPH